MHPNTDVYIQSIFRERGIFSLPGVGTFRKARYTARLSEQGDQVLPPGMRAVFSPEVEADVLLSTQLVHQIGMDRMEAAAIEQGLINTLNARTHAGLGFSVAGLGLLRLDNQGRMLFEPTDNPIAASTGTFFGLKPVALSESFSISPPTQESIITADMATSSSTPKRARGIGWKTFLILLGLPILGIGIVKFGPVQIMSRQQAIAPREGGEVPRMDQVETSAPLAAREAPNEGETNSSLETEVSPESPSSYPTPSPAHDREATPPAADLLAEGETPPTHEAPAQEAQPNSQNNARVAQPEAARTRSMPQADEASAQQTGTGNRTHISILDTSQTQQAPPPQQTRSISSRLLAEKEKPYHLVISSFHVQDRARERVKELQALGYNPIVLQSRDTDGRTLYRISIFRSEDRSEVEAFYSRFRKQGGPNGWIFDRRKG